MDINIHNVIESIANGKLTNNIDGWELTSERELTSEEMESVKEQLEKGNKRGTSPCKWELSFNRR